MGFACGAALSCGAALECVPLDRGWVELHGLNVELKKETVR